MQINGRADKLHLGEKVTPYRQIDQRSRAKHPPASMSSSGTKWTS
jgi:hypothetical protein